MTPYQIAIENLAANCKALLDPENDPEALNAFFMSDAGNEREQIAVDLTLKSHPSEHSSRSQSVSALPARNNTSPPVPDRTPSKPELNAAVTVPKNVTPAEKKRNRRSREAVISESRDLPVSTSASQMGVVSSPTTSAGQRSAHNRTKSAAIEARVALFQGKKWRDTHRWTIFVLLLLNINTHFTLTTSVSTRCSCQAIVKYPGRSRGLRNFAIVHRRTNQNKIITCSLFLVFSSDLFSIVFGQSQDLNDRKGSPLLLAPFLDRVSEPKVCASYCFIYKSSARKACKMKRKNESKDVSTRARSANK